MAWKKNVKGYKRPMKKMIKKSTTDTASLALKKVKRLEKSVETKYLGHDISGLVDDFGSSMSLTNGIAQGVQDAAQRIGDKLKLLNCYLHLNLEAPLPGGGTTRYTTANFVRIIVFKDKCMNMPAVTDIIDASFVGTPSIVNCFTIFDKKEEFKLLYDKTYAIQNNGQDAQRHYRIKIPLQYLASYSGPGATDVDKNGLRFIICSDEPTLATNITYRLHTRITYKDS